jgi:DNA-binding CsgD family transcriptional regulator
MIDELNSFIETASGALTAAKIGDRLAGTAERLGFTATLIVDPAKVRPRIKSAVSFSKHLDEFKSYERKEPFAEHPLTQYAAVVDTPFDLATMCAILGYRERDIRQRLVTPVQEMHVVAFPVHRSGKLVLYVACAGDKPDDTPASRVLLHACAHAAYDLTVSLEPLNELSRREADCLHWMAQGKSYKAVGRILGLAERTVRAAVASAKLKLHARNKSEVIAKAIGRGP